MDPLDPYRKTRHTDPPGERLRPGQAFPKPEDRRTPPEDPEALPLESWTHDSVELSLESQIQSSHDEDPMGSRPSSWFYFDPGDENEGGSSYQAHREVEELRLGDLDFRLRMEQLPRPLQEAAALFIAGFSEREVGQRLRVSRHEARQMKEELANHLLREPGVD